MSKQHSLSQLKKIIREQKELGKRVVLANGCFDLIHVGHTRYLRESKKQGDILVLALNSDPSVRGLEGRGRPLLSEKERVEILSSFSSVDHIIVFSEPDVNRILLALKPHVHAKGSDYTEDTVPERETVRKYEGTVAITGGPKVRSTSDILKDIASRFGPTWGGLQKG